MAKKLYDLAVRTGEYQKDGETKGRFKNIGVIMEGDKGPYMLLEKTFNPAGVPDIENRESLIVGMYAPKEEAKPSFDDDEDF